MATLWDNPVSDGRGWFTFDEPVLINCRWEDKQQEYTDDNGQIKMSSSMVNVGQDILSGCYLALGDYTEDSNYLDPADINEAKKVVSFEKIPDIKGTTFVAICYLAKDRL